MDLILRDIGRVRNIVERTEEGDFCFEQTWYLNEKKAISRIDSFECAPVDYSERVNHIFKVL